MSDRVLQWVGAGVLTAGLSTAMLLGAGIAAADPESATGDGATSSSQSDDEASSTAAQDDSTEATQELDDEATDVSDEEPAVEEEAPDEGAEEPAEVDDTTDESAADKSRDIDAVAVDTEEPVEPTEPEAEPEVLTRHDQPVVAEAPEPEPEPVAPTFEPVAAVGEEQAPTETEPSTARFVMAAVEEEAARAMPTLINVVGTIAWSVFDFFAKILMGPPAVPARSSVTVGRSKLEIDCGDGYTAEADWYYPKEAEPEKFIYFQHGFPGRAGVYNVTAAELAERNNAIVVAPSITGNIFACDGCGLGADPMHAAVARLFEGDRAALLASAQAAGYEGALPEQFVITGHSGGGQLAAGAAGYFHELAPADDKGDMVGVLLFDTSATGGALARALEKLPAELPVLHIAARPGPFNTFGNANDVLVESRPDQFNGVRLVGGSHSDAFRSSTLFGLVQLIVGAGTGPSAPENVEAVQVLSQGWITDMYEGRVYNPATRTGIYGNPGQPGEAVVEIPTDAGPAQAYVLPGPPHAFSLFDRIIMALLGSMNANDFATCATDPSAVAATSTCTADSRAV